MTKEHEEMLNMVRSAMEIAESRASYAASVRLLFDATVDVMQLEVNGKVYTLRAGEEKALRMAQREIGRAREDVEEEAAEMEVTEDGREWEQSARDAAGKALRKWTCRRGKKRYSQCLKQGRRTA